MEQKEQLHLGGNTVYNEPLWWGVTVGRQAFAAFAATGEEARFKVADLIGITPDKMIEVPTISVVYGPEDQLVLEREYAEKDVVQLEPHYLSGNN